MIMVNSRNQLLTKLGIIDLEILYLGIRGAGKFDEKDIEESDLKKLGVGRILDQLASLKERNLIEMNKDGSFTVTSIAHHILWDERIPLWIKILRILEIKSLNIEKISSYLSLLPNQVYLEIEDLRKRNLVLMSPLRTESGIEKMYEVLPEGIEQIKIVQSEGIHNKPEFGKPKLEILSIFNKTVEEIQSVNGISNEKKSRIISQILQIKDKLQI